MITANELRKKYIEFFKSKGHVEIPSARLVPENDPSTLFTGSGMQPMVPFLLGEKHPLGNRIVDSQKCFRSQDIEEVGDNRHTTFFEMLGNWSLGDYFKKEQVTWMFEFLTKELGLDPSRLYISAFEGSPAIGIPRDDETVALWQKCFADVGIDAKIGERIFFYPEKKNWWSRSGTPDKMPVGEPGGPDTEMFWDFGAELQLHEASQWKDEPCHVNCDCGRYMEIGNNVFMQYIKTADGFLTLPKKNVDFGGGLERMMAAVMDNPDVFGLDIFVDAIALLETKAHGQAYGVDPAITHHMRVVVDHMRAATFLIADGVLPSNKDQGYVLRRLLRRAIFRMEKLRVDPAELVSIARTFITFYATQPEFSYFHDREIVIAQTIEQEITKFTRSLAMGEKELEKMITKQESLSAEQAFLLFQSYGFPWELTYEIAQSHGMSLDRDAFETEFKKHQDASRSASEQKFAGGLADHSIETTKLHTATHLLHQALRDVLGLHVAQKGSNITAERLRFDFSHGEKMTPEQIARVEAIVNEQIKKDMPIHFEMLTVDEASARGAIGLFGDKYATIGDKLKVYFVGDYSKEICGGPHVTHTGELGGIKILKEEAVSAGVRRIKAVLC